MPTLTRLDLTDVENAKDAARELHRATTEEELLAWARKWGEAAINAIERFTGIRNRNDY